MRIVGARLAILIKRIQVWQGAQCHWPVPRCHSPGRLQPAPFPLLGNALVRNRQVNGAESCDAYIFLLFFWYRKEEWGEGPAPRWAQAQPDAEECVTTVLLEAISRSCCRTPVSFLSSLLWRSSVEKNFWESCPLAEVRAAKPLACRCPR